MSRARNSPDDLQWQDTKPLPLPRQRRSATRPAANAADTKQRPEPAFEQTTQGLHGLEIRELEGQTVFDQHFGTVPRR